MDDKDNWKRDTWKTAISLTEKLTLLFLGVLVLPSLMGQAPYSLVGLIAGVLCVAISSVVWLVLVLYGFRQGG